MPPPPPLQVGSAPFVQILVLLQFGSYVEVRFVIKVMIRTDSQWSVEVHLLSSLRWIVQITSVRPKPQSQRTTDQNGEVPAHISDRLENRRYILYSENEKERRSSSFFFDNQDFSNVSVKMWQAVVQLTGWKLHPTDFTNLTTSILPNLPDPFIPYSGFLFSHNFVHIKSVDHINVTILFLLLVPSIT